MDQFGSSGLASFRTYRRLPTTVAAPLERSAVSPFELIWLAFDDWSASPSIRGIVLTVIGAAVVVLDHSVGALVSARVKEREREMGQKE